MNQTFSFSVLVAGAGHSWMSEFYGESTSLPDCRLLLTHLSPSCPPSNTPHLMEVHVATPSMHSDNFKLGESILRNSVL